jgi:hypothetical protein
VRARCGLTGVAIQCLFKPPQFNVYLSRRRRHAPSPPPRAIAMTVEFCYRQRHYVCRARKRSYRGVTKLIAALCAKRSTLHNPRKAKGAAKARKCSTYGVVGGCRVDAAINRAVRAGREADPKCAEVALFFRELGRHGLQAVEAQYVVWCDGSGIATSIDVLARRLCDGGVVALEVKCGYDGTWTTHNGMLRHPAAGLRNDPRTLAFVQVCVGADLLASVADEAPADVAVVRILPRGATLEYVPKAVLGAMDVLCAHLRRPAAAAVSRPARKRAAKPKR